MGLLSESNPVTVQSFDFDTSSYPTLYYVHLSGEPFGLNWPVPSLLSLIHSHNQPSPAWLYVVEYWNKSIQSEKISWNKTIFCMRLDIMKPVSLSSKISSSPLWMISRLIFFAYGLFSFLIIFFLVRHFGVESVSCYKNLLPRSPSLLSNQDTPRSSTPSESTFPPTASRLPLAYASKSVIFAKLVHFFWVPSFSSRSCSTKLPIWLRSQSTYLLLTTVPSLPSYP